MSVELKVKSKHLAEETKIIRFEERKCLEKYRKSLNSNYDTNHKFIFDYDKLRTHRIVDVRNEQRATFLSRAFLDGKKYSEVERNPLWKTRRGHDAWEFRDKILLRVYMMVMKYSSYDKNYRKWVSGRYVPSDKCKEDVNQWLGI